MRSKGLALTLLLMAPAAAAAQDGPVVYGGAGLVWPTGKSAATYRPGFDVGLQVSFPLSSRIAVQGVLDYRELRRDDTEAVTRVPHLAEDLGQFRLGGGFFDGANHRTVAALVRLQLPLRERGSRLLPYVAAGGGLAHTRVGDLEVYFLGGRESQPGESHTGLVADVAGGLEVRTSHGVAVFGQVGWLVLLAEDAATAMVPAQLGLSVDLGAM